MLVVVVASSAAAAPLATRAGTADANEAAASRLVSSRAVGARDPYARLRGLMKPGALLSMPVAGDITLELRTSRSGGVALGPAGFQRRASAASNPMALIGRFQDNATSVLGAGLGTERLKLEGSVFNSQRATGVPRSYAARLSLSPLEPLNMQISYGSVLGSTRDARLTRLTASATVQTEGLYRSVWSTTALWGASLPSADEPVTHGALVEADVHDKHHNLFGRLEYDQRLGTDLGLAADTPIEHLGNATLGYIYSFSAIGSLLPGESAAEAPDAKDRRQS